MNKYIDAEKLIKSVNRYRDNAKAAFNPIEDDADYYKGKIDAYEDIQKSITSLQQEQPEIKSHIEELLKECAGKDGEYYRGRRETLAHLFAYLGGNPLEYILQPVKQPEVDLEKEIDACWNSWLSPSNQKEVEGVLPKTEFAMYARHFYELGHKAKKEE